MLGTSINTGNNVVGGAQQNTPVVESTVLSTLAEPQNMVASDNSLNLGALPSIKVATASSLQESVNASPSFVQYFRQQLSNLGSLFKGFVSDSLNSLASYPLMKPVAMGLAGVMSWVGVENFNPSVVRADIIYGVSPELNSTASIGTRYVPNLFNGEGFLDPADKAVFLNLPGNGQYLNTISSYVVYGTAGGGLNSGSLSEMSISVFGFQDMSNANIDSLAGNGGVMPELLISNIQPSNISLWGVDNLGTNIYKVDYSVYDNGYRFLLAEGQSSSLGMTFVSPENYGTFVASALGDVSSPYMYNSLATVNINGASNPLITFQDFGKYSNFAAYEITTTAVPESNAGILTLIAGLAFATRRRKE